MGVTTAEKGMRIFLLHLTELCLQEQAQVQNLHQTPDEAMQALGLKIAGEWVQKLISCAGCESKRMIPKDGCNDCGKGYEDILASPKEL
jgi:hypothetical protein